MQADERILKSDESQHYTLGVVYSPNEIDSQGDYADAKDIEKACHAFTERLQGMGEFTKQAVDLLGAIVKAVDDGVEVAVDIDDIYEDIQKGPNGPLGIMHMIDGNNAGKIVENYVLPCDAEINGETVKKGSWLMGVVWSPAFFAKIKDGTFTGYSMGGQGNRIPDGDTKKKDPANDKK